MKSLAMVVLLAFVIGCEEEVEPRWNPPLSNPVVEAPTPDVPTPDVPIEESQLYRDIMSNPDSAKIFNDAVDEQVALMMKEIEDRITAKGYVPAGGGFYHRGIRSGPSDTEVQGMIWNFTGEVTQPTRFILHLWAKTDPSEVSQLEFSIDGLDTGSAGFFRVDISDVPDDRFTSAILLDLDNLTKDQ